jgi:hypothetical protein
MTTTHLASACMRVVQLTGSKAQMARRLAVAITDTREEVRGMDPDDGLDPRGLLQDM